MSDAWPLKPGDTIVRKDLHRDYGGRRQGGISPSNQSANVFLFTDPASGEPHGYIDSWNADGHYHYTGAGQTGDQKMTDGNGVVLNHVKQGRSLRLFQGASGTVMYIGEFELGNPAWYETDAPATGDEEIRTVIVFRLHPKKSLSPRRSPAPAVARQDVVSHVPVEMNKTETFAVNPSATPRHAERVEAALVSRFAEYLEQRGFVSYRQRIYPADEVKPLYTDLFVEAPSILIEAKGSVTRENVRMAIGQLADYRRFVDPQIQALLVPSRPRPDLLTLLVTEGISVIWEVNAKFEGQGHAAEQLFGMPAGA